MKLLRSLIASALMLSFMSIAYLWHKDAALKAEVMQYEALAELVTHPWVKNIGAVTRAEKYDGNGEEKYITKDSLMLYVSPEARTNATIVREVVFVIDKPRVGEFNDRDNQLGPLHMVRIRSFLYDEGRMTPCPQFTPSHWLTAM